MSRADLAPFLTAAVIGLLIGFERERSHPESRIPAGSRTFALLSLSGALAALFGTAVVAAGVLAVGGVLVVAYRRTSDTDTGTTTEVAALATFLLGALAYGHAPLAAGLAIVATVLLASKARIHGFAHHVVSDVELEDALKFLVIAFVVLPLLPDAEAGPYGVLNPRRIWLIVVFLTGISWVGYVAVRALGPRRGLLATGMAGGFVSASATTASMARLGRETGNRDAVPAALTASVATFVQLLLVVAVIDRGIAVRLVAPLLLGTVVLGAIAFVQYRRSDSPAEGPAPPDLVADDAAGADGATRPFRLTPALVLAAILTVALLVARWMADVLGSDGAVLAAGFAGLADAHAGAVSAATLHQKGSVSLAAALLAIGAALVANTATKAVLAFSTGGRSFGVRFTASLVPVIVVVVAALGVVAAMG